jgi:predicted house-cleaning noncanonical NTP pyrophosphatase (MazG superfamily)
MAALLEPGVIRHDKLVRDRIPEIVERAGKRPIFRTLDATAYRLALREKLVEEAREVAAASDAERLDEFADLAEVLDAALAAHGIGAEDLRRRREARNAERGGFAGRIYLESVED